jgi:hypothetical protein
MRIATHGHAVRGGGTLTMKHDRCILDVIMADFPGTPYAAGALVYEYMRREVVGDNVLSMDRLGSTLVRCQTPLGDQAEGEIVIGCMFAAVLAIEELAPSPLHEELRAGLDGEFINHLHEQGADDEHVVEWRTILGEHFVDYFRSMEGHSSAALPDALGKEFLWNLTGVEEEDPAPIEVATSYLAAARAVARRVLQQTLGTLKR